MSTVIPSTVLSLHDLAGALLLVAEDSLATTEGGVPDRSYLSPAAPAFDCCPMLAVYAPLLTEGPTLTGPGGLSPGHRTLRGSVNLATLLVVAVRCAPSMGANGNPPTVASIEEVARLVMQDGWALWNGLRHAIRDGRFAGLCTEVFFDGAASIPEQGNCVGWAFTIRAELNGIPWEDGS